MGAKACFVFKQKVIDLLAANRGGREGIEERLLIKIAHHGPKSLMGFWIFSLKFSGELARSGIAVRWQIEVYLSLFAT